MQCFLIILSKGSMYNVKSTFPNKKLCETIPYFFLPFTHTPVELLPHDWKVEGCNIYR